VFEIQLKPKAVKFIKRLPPKHQRQVKNYIMALGSDPFPKDSKSLVNYKPYFRGDVGEYRIIYRHSKEKNLVTVVLVGKRNDGEVYKRMRRNL